MNSIVGPIFNEKFDKKLNLWVRKQCTDALFTEDWSKVAATVHIPYMNSTACRGKHMKKKKKKKNAGNLKHSKRYVDPNSALEPKYLIFFNSIQCALFTDPQILLFSNFFIKNGFHGTIHIYI